MKELVIILGAYILIGIVVCIAFSFRKSKSPQALKAIHMIGPDLSYSSFGIGLLLWPLWLFMQIVEQDTLEPPSETKIKEREEVLDFLVGRIGITVTPMIPTGRIKIDEKDYESMSDEGKIERGEEVEVLAFSMGILKVRRFQPNA